MKQIRPEIGVTSGVISRSCVCQANVVVNALEWTPASIACSYWCPLLLLPSVRMLSEIHWLSVSRLQQANLIGCALDFVFPSYLL